MAGETNVADAPGKTAARKARILVVDDSRSVRELLELHLRGAGYDVLGAEDAVVAGKLTVERLPDLLIVDVNMPYMSGIDFVSALRADPEVRGIPVIFLSSREDVAQEAHRLGAVACLTKPVAADRLLEIIALQMQR
jgi:DNA-binding response OmpR family regulator